MIRTWQDFDPNYSSGWGQWYASLSRKGHIVQIVGPFHTEEQARLALGDD
jgi:hypothetical protein